MWHTCRLKHSNGEKKIQFKIGRKCCNDMKSIFSDKKNKNPLNCSTQKWSQVAKENCPKLEYFRHSAK